MSEEVARMAPGLLKALAPEETEEQDNRRRRRGNENIIALRSWSPKTRLGQMVLAGEIITMEQAYTKREDIISQ